MGQQINQLMLQVAALQEALQRESDLNARISEQNDIMGVEI